MNDLHEIRISFAGACVGFGSSAVGACHVCPSLAKILAIFAAASFAVIALTFIAEGILDKRNEPAPTEAGQARYENIFGDSISIAENLGLVKEGGRDD